MMEDPLFVRTRGGWRCCLRALGIASLRCGGGVVVIVVAKMRRCPLGLRSGVEGRSKLGYVGGPRFGRTLDKSLAAPPGRGVTAVPLSAEDRRVPRLLLLRTAPGGRRRALRSFSAPPRIGSLTTLSSRRSRRLGQLSPFFFLVIRASAPLAGMTSGCRPWPFEIQERSATASRGRGATRWSVPGSMCSGGVWRLNEHFGRGNAPRPMRCVENKMLCR